ncbi:MAG: hypothetical protein R3C03_22270 [Pirellulaceae bacterium]
MSSVIVKNGSDYELIREDVPTNPSSYTLNFGGTTYTGSHQTYGTGLCKVNFGAVSGLTDNAENTGLNVTVCNSDDPPNCMVAINAADKILVIA